MDKFDGSISFIAGMDASKPPHLLEQGYYHRGCNLSVSHVSGKLTQRPGFEAMTLIGDADAICLYEHGRNYQAEGYYKSGNRISLLRLIDGWLLEFVRVTDNKLSVKLLNPDDRRNQYVSKGWITTVPGGAIVNDGESYPFIVRPSGIRRTDPSKDEIGVGRMGIYVQNRYFYVDPSSKYILVSDFRNPVSVLNAKIANIQGFILPEDQGEISAIGIRKQSLNYVDGGVLTFSTPNNTYSIDVRGDIQNWEEGGNGLGKVQESLPGIGAISSYSYEAFSSDLYFRTINYGIGNIGYLEDQFNRGNSYTSQSTEVLCWMDLDTKRFLSKCYTRRIGSRLLTTVGAKINDYGYVYWSGLISARPKPIYNSSRLPDVYEGLWTGVRPLGMTSFEDQLLGEELFVDSYDTDGHNRLYRLSDKLTSDINHLGKTVEIKSWLETKSYNFGDFPNPKRVESRSYTLSDLQRSLKVLAHSRKDGFGAWIKFSEREHLVKRVNMGVNSFGMPYFQPKSSSAQQRNNVQLNSEIEDKSSSIGGMGGSACYSRQYRLEFEGPFSLENFLVYAIPDNISGSSTAQEKDKKIVGQNKLLDYNYLIV